MALDKNYDAIVVGGGHNGLVAASYLARAGKKVVLLEAEAELGGATTSVRPFPEFDARLSRYSYLVSLLPDQIVSDLGINFKTLERSIASYTPYSKKSSGADGGLLISQNWDERTAQSFQELTGSDAEGVAWQHFYGEIAELARRIAPSVLQPLKSAEKLKEEIGLPQTWSYLMERPIGEVIRERFGDDVVIGEGAFIDPYDEGGLASTFQTSLERVAFSANAFKELRAGAATSFDIGRKKIVDFIESVVQARPASALGQKCGMDRTDNLAVDLNGNVLTCQNVSAAAVAPNGESHKIGHISQLQSVKMRSATHWSKREECSGCPVLQLCKGSCMFLDGPLWTAGCDASYADNVPFLAAGIEFLTGCFPFYIEGNFPQERRDIFGLVSEHSEAKARRVIPIKVEHA